MPRLPLYELEDAPKSIGGGHAGLFHGRFFDLFDPDEDWEVEKGASQRWSEKLAGQVGDSDRLERNALRQLRLARTLEAESRAFEVAWCFVTGTGLPHPVENGFSWHPTQGVPFVCGAAVKGLLKAWVEKVAEMEEPAREERLERWFGTDKGAGCLVFFDTLPIHCPSLKADVMTPHMGKWYELGQEITYAGDGEKVPGDWHSPNPIHFLVVDRATLLFTIAGRNAEGKQEVKKAMDALGQALDELGAGAKTAAGYGQMLPSNYPLSPAQQSIRKILDSRSNEATRDWVTLSKALEAGHWKGEEAVEVARHIQTLMIVQKDWRQTVKARKVSKDKRHRYSELIQRILSNKTNRG